MRNSRTVKKALLTSVCFGESTYASIVRVGDRSQDVSRGRDIERSAVEIYRYSHARVAWHYHLHVSQSVTPTVSPRNAYRPIRRCRKSVPNRGYRDGYQ